MVVSLFLMLNVKQGICEYQCLKAFWSDLARELNPGLPTTRWML